MLAEIQGGAPIYGQIMDIIKGQIITGARPAGARMPSVRELAVDFAVNPNTVQRALSELEREGLLYTERTAGRYITTDTGRVQQLKAKVVQNLAVEFLTRMQALGYTNQEARAVLDNLEGEKL